MPSRTERAKASKPRLSLEREAELSDLAAAVVETHCRDGRIDPEKVIKAKDIPLYYDNYADAFDGLIEYVDGRFHIHCNLDRENLPGTPRARFTLSHELGHYFIDEHRNNLASGKVYPHPSFSDKCVGDLLVEREADFFASRLLMPDARFKQAARKCPGRLNSIESVAGQFEVSLTCAAIRFVTAEVFPAVLIKWSHEGYSWKWCSKQFWELGYRKTVESKEALANDSATSKCLISKGEERSIIETGTTASSWFPSVHQRSIRNLILREEARALGRFGVLTLITLHNGQFPEEVVASRDYELGIR